MQEWALTNGLADVYLAGLAGAVGVSNYGPKQLRRIHSDLARRGVRERRQRRHACVVEMHLRGARERRSELREQLLRR